MAIDDQDGKSQSQMSQTGKWVLRVLAIIIGVVAAIDLVTMLIPMPAPQQPMYTPGLRVEYHSSDTETSIIRAKNWAQSYINPVGWVALFKGFGPDRLYILKRDEGWKNALETGQTLTLIALLVLPVALWMFSTRAAVRKSLET